VGRSPALNSAGEAFGRSSVVQDSLKLYYDTVDEFFKTLTHPPMNARLATDILMAAVHGTIVFPCMTRTMEWSDTRLMVKHLVTSIVDDWGKNSLAA